MSRVRQSADKISSLQRFHIQYDVDHDSDNDYTWLICAENWQVAIVHCE